jgi:hypothetical protein
MGGMQQHELVYPAPERHMEVEAASSAHWVCWWEVVSKLTSDAGLTSVLAGDMCLHEV